MAGHRKWAKVKHFKGAIDAKRGRIFAKLSRETTIAAKRGGGDSDVNPRLRMARLRCQMAHLPKDNRNRRAADTRRLVTQSGDSIATADSVTRRFHRKGQIIVSREAAPENQLMELALAAGAEGFTVKEIYSNAEFPD